MKKKFKQTLGTALTIIMILSICVAFTSCKKPVHSSSPDVNEVKSYTYKSGTLDLGATWNPHTASTATADEIYSYISSPLVDISIEDSVNGIYQWVYEMATEVTDVTASHKNDLEKYKVNLPDGKNVNDVKSGYVFEIKLNPNAAWENGVKITADDYIYSMEMLLNPKLRNPNAKNYVSGEFAIAGALSFYNSETPVYALAIDLNTNEKVENADVYYLDLDAPWILSSKYSIKSMYEDGYIFDEYETKVGEDGNPVYVLDENGEKIQTAFGATYYKELAARENAYGYVPFTSEDLSKIEVVVDQFLAVFGINGETSPDYRWSHYYYANGIFDKVDYTNSVGCYSTDDYTIIYVCENQVDREYFLSSLASNWLVYKPLYEACMNKSDELWTTTYCTSLETTMSYGPYKMNTFKKNEQVTLVQNEGWYGYERNEDGTAKKDNEGNLISYTSFLVDGKNVRQYATTKIEINVFESKDALKYEFLKGNLAEYYPEDEEELLNISEGSIVSVDDPYVMAFFFNTKLNALMHLDSKGENENSAVLSSYNFRKAFSFALDRVSLALQTSEYKPAFTLINDLYHYDIYNDPASYYRKSDEAMKAIVELYGIEYGAGKEFNSLEEAYAFITGFDLAQAKVLMKQAHDELVASDIYNSGEEIKIQIAWSKKELTSSDLNQCITLEKLINEAAKDSGFGRITFEPIGNVNNRYDAVPYGQYAMGYGAWGSTNLNPFEYMKLHCEGYPMVSEPPSWDPNHEKLTININGKDITMTWENWSKACTTGEYADADFETKLLITATMEKEFLNLYHHIPIYKTTTSHFMSFRILNYTKNYNPMYGFGGFRLIQYTADDVSWEKDVVENAGHLD